MRCSGGGAFACYSVLAALIAAVLALGGAAAQDGTRTWLLTRAYNASGQQLFEQFSTAPGNIVFSPYSIGTAMAMVLAGARGETELQMAGVLRHALARDDVADALMLTKHGGVVSKDYIALLKDKYAAEVFEDAGLEQINGWVARKTEGKIDKILDRLDQSSAAVLINAISAATQSPPSRRAGKMH